jgi:outer membrane protein insertion porin family
MQVQAGDTFSREKVTQTSKAISDRLSNDGYAFSNVNAVPELNKEQHTAAFTFFVDPGKRVYVRRINIVGNTRTRDEVVRREVRQLESAWYASNKINRSKERLVRTGYFSDVNVETPAVPGTADQVDLNVSVVEQSTGSVQFGAGLSSSEGVVFGVTVNQNNFLGTGNRVSAQVNTGKVNTTYSLSYTDPYFTPDGVSRGFDVYRRDVNTGSTNNVGTYSTSSYGGGVRFGIPLNERDGFNIGLAVDFTKIDLYNDSPEQYQKFCGNTTGCTSNSVVATAGWAHDSRDSIMYTSNGVLQKLSGELSMPVLDLQYYKIDYKHAWFKEVTKGFTFMLNGEIGYADSYGSKEYPFFKNFFMGGVNSVRGYDNGSLGPRNTDSSGLEYAVGGTKRILGNAELFLPIPGLKDSKQFRLSAFIDGGNVWGAGNPYNLSDLRYSTGMGISWFSPFGPLKLIYAKPLNDQSGDKTQSIQFQLGQQF